MLSKMTKYAAYIISVAALVTVLLLTQESLIHQLAYTSFCNFLVGKSYAAMSSPNMLYNSSFEITTNPDIPDGWSRDYALPPWGDQVYSIDDKNSFHGAKSLRLGSKGKYVRSWGRHTKITIGREYTFSVYLKSDRNHVQVSLDLRNAVSRVIYADTEWKRFFITGIAKESDTECTIHLKSDGVLWIDAAQLEEGTYASNYVPSESDYEDYDDILKKKYERLYAVTRSDAQCSAIKQDSRKEGSFDLVGTEFDFYTTENNVRVRCFMNKLLEGKTSAELSWHLEKDGRLIGVPHEMIPKPRKNEWSLDIGDLPSGEYVLKAKYTEDESTIIQKQSKFRKLPPNQHEVRINRWGRFLVVDGTPFFFYGFYDNLSHGPEERWKSVLREMKSINTNGVINYVGGSKEYEMLGWALDEAYKNNQKIIVTIQRNIY